MTQTQSDVRAEPAAGAPATAGQTHHELARAALSGWGLPGDTAATLLNLSENATFRVPFEASSHGTAVLRMHRVGYHDEAAIRSELAWTDAVRRDLGVCVPTPIPTVTGDVLHRLRDGEGRMRHAVLFEEISGVEPPPDDLDRHLPLLGQLAARFHRHVETWRRPTTFTRFVWSQPELLGERARWGRLRDGLGVDDQRYAVLRRAADEVSRRLAAYGTASARFGLIHADMRLANLLIDGDRVAIIDFDDSGYSWLLYDLAATLSFVEHDPRVPQWCHAWLDGYQQERPLSRHDRSMVASFVMLRRLVLVAWLGSHADIPLAAELGTAFAGDATVMAEHYLAGSGWAREVGP